MHEQEVLTILEKVGAVITGSHIVYTSGKHGTAYVNKDALYPHTVETSRLCFEIAVLFADDQVDVVIGPAQGGIILAQWTASHLSIMKNREVLAVYAEKESEDKFIIKRGQDKFIPRARILVVEDVLTTGGSVKKVIEAARAIGGNVIGVGALCNRGGVRVTDIDLDYRRLESLVHLPLEAWDEDECARTGPCSLGVPINEEVGKGREFMARRRS